MTDVRPTDGPVSLPSPIVFALPDGALGSTVLEGTTAHDLPNPLADRDDTLGVNPTCRVQGGPALSVFSAALAACASPAPTATTAFAAPTYASG